MPGPFASRWIDASTGARWLFAALLFLLPFGGIALADGRVALVVGNSAYQNTAALPNPRNDAEDVAKTLEGLGFKVILRTDATKGAFESALADFERESQSADAALFYFAGHGMQFQGRNYLMPVDAQLRDQISLHYEMVSVDDLREQMAGLPGLKIIILDSCRDNPLAETFARSISVKTRSMPVTRGLAPVESLDGLLVVYSTSPNSVAQDGEGRNSPFSQAFLEELKVPGAEAVTVFRRVQRKVSAITHKRQSPEVLLSTVPDFYFNLAKTDQEAWQAARDSRNRDKLAEFVSQYPASEHVGDARTLLDILASAAAPSRVVLPETPQPTPTPESAKTVTAATPTPEPVAPTPEPVKTAPPAKLAEAVPEPAPTRPPEPVKAPAPVDPFPSIRAELRRLGCYFGGDLGWETPQARWAIQRYAEFARVSSASLQPNADLLDALRRRPANFCHLDCAATQMERGGRCVARICPEGEVLTPRGACVRPPPPAPPPEKRVQARVREPDSAPEFRPEPRPHPHPRHEGGGGGGGKCFNFNGNSYCE